MYRRYLLIVLSSKSSLTLFYIVRCPAPTDIDFSAPFDQDTYAAGTVISLRCIEGYNIRGPTEATCGLDGVFETSASVCVPGILFLN